MKPHLKRLGSQADLALAECWYLDSGSCKVACWGAILVPHRRHPQRLDRCFWRFRWAEGFRDTLVRFPHGCRVVVLADLKGVSQ